MAERERRSLRTFNREKEKENMKERKTKREQAASISNPADCQMTRGMVQPLVAVLPSFLPFPLLPSFSLRCLCFKRLSYLQVFKTSKSAIYYTISIFPCQ